MTGQINQFETIKSELLADSPSAMQRAAKLTSEELDLVDANKNTLLHHMIFQGRSEVGKIVVERSSTEQLHRKNQAGVTAYKAAKLFNNPELADVIDKKLGASMTTNAQQRDLPMIKSSEKDVARSGQ